MSYFVPNESALPCYHVGKGQQFESFVDCVWSLQNDFSEKIIFVHGGEYDVFEEYRHSDVPRTPVDLQDVHSFRPYNAILSKNTHVIGLGVVVLKYMPTAEQTYLTESKVVSPLNLADSATVENIEIHCKNGRYCIHDETMGIETFAGAQKRYKDVICHRYENDGELGNAPCIGFGFDNMMSFEFDGCEFYSHNHGPAFYMHNRSNSGDYHHLPPNGEPRVHVPYTLEESSRIQARSCIIATEDRSAPCVNLGVCTVRQHHVRVHFDGCFFSGPIVCKDENSANGGTRPNPYDLRLLHCNDVPVIIPYKDNVYPARIFK